MILDNPTYISSSQPVIITDPYVIFYNLIPATLSWDATKQNEFFIVNSTNGIIPLAEGTFYFDTQAEKQTSIAPGLAIDIVKNALGEWHVSTSPNSNGGDTTLVPIATYSSLGVVKIGAGLTILADGTLSAGTSTTTVSWNDITNKPNFAVVAFSGSYIDLANKPAIPTQVSQLINDVGFITSSALTWNNITGKPFFAPVATSGAYADLTGKPTIPAQLNAQATPGITITGTYPNLTWNLTGGSSFINSLTTLGTSGPATVVSGVLNIPQYSGGGGSITSVFGRTGVVSAQAGDYTASQVTGALVSSNNLSDVANTGTARVNLGVPSYTAGSNITITGSFPNLAINASGSLSVIT